MERKTKTGSQKEESERKAIKKIKKTEKRKWMMKLRAWVCSLINDSVLLTWCL